MSRTSISTSSAIFSDGQERAIRPKATLNKPLRVAILGDFSGRESRNICEPNTIAQRPAHRLTKDSFERVFERLSVCIKLPVSDEPIALLDYDDLHPDYLYSRVPLFKQFISLRKQLLDTQKFNEAADEIQTWAHFQNESVGNKESEPEQNQFMLDSILSSSSYKEQYERSPQGQIDALIKDIVAPYVIPSADPRQQDLLSAVDEATNESMRKIMHQSAFQNIEASWRSLNMLVRRLDDNIDLYLDIIDVTKQELLDDLGGADNELEQAQIFKRLVSNQTDIGNMPYNLIVGDFYIEDTEQDISLLIDLATISQAVEGSFISGGSTKLAECPNLAGSVDPDDWHYPLNEEFRSGWSALRDFDAAEHVVLAAPRFLIRLPYGKNTSTTDCLEFEELPAEKGHKYYLWGNSGYLILLQMCEAFNQQGSAFNLASNMTIGGLPVHVFNAHGSTTLKPCAEAMLTDASTYKFESAGITTVRSVQNKDEVRVPKIQSIHRDGYLRGAWNI